MMRIVVVLMAFLGIFWFPWPLALVGILIASVCVPLSGVVLGITLDVLYAPGIGYPLGTLIGLSSSVFGFMVERFLLTRIMSA